MSSKSTDMETMTVEKAAEDKAVEETVKAEEKMETVKAVKGEKKAEKEETKAAKKSAAKKTATKKADKPELKPEIYLEYHGHQIEGTSVVEKVKESFVSSGHRVSSIKSLQIYMKPEEFKAYYVINDGKFTGDVDLF